MSLGKPDDYDIELIGKILKNDNSSGGKESCRHILWPKDCMLLQTVMYISKIKLQTYLKKHFLIAWF